MILLKCFQKFVSLGLNTNGNDSYTVKKHFIREFLLGTFERSGGVVFPFRDGRKRKITGHLYKIVKNTVLGVMDGTLPHNNGKLKDMPASMRVVKKKVK